jgi:hypothetical protein
MTPTEKRNVLMANIRNRNSPGSPMSSPPTIKPPEYAEPMAIDPKDHTVTAQQNDGESDGEDTQIPDDITVDELLDDPTVRELLNSAVHEFGLNYLNDISADDASTVMASLDNMCTDLKNKRFEHTVTAELLDSVASWLQ